jgi:predicted RNA-binding protein YlxR (DUF448 family)
MGSLCQRKCIGCQALKNREELIKITRSHTDKEIIINPNSNIFGRSAYLCYNSICIEAAFKKNKLQKVLKAPVKDKLLNELRNSKSK